MEKAEKQYECLFCKSKFQGKEKNCPICGAKQYYCQFVGCEKQIDKPGIKYCSEHAFAMHKAKKTATPFIIIAIIVIFFLAPLMVILPLATKGKINPAKWLLARAGINLP